MKITVFTVVSLLAGASAETLKGSRRLDARLNYKCVDAVIASTTDTGITSIGWNGEALDTKGGNFIAYNRGISNCKSMTNVDGVIMDYYFKKVGLVTKDGATTADTATTGLTKVQVTHTKAGIAYPVAFAAADTSGAVTRGAILQDVNTAKDDSSVRLTCDCTSVVGGPTGDQSSAAAADCFSGEGSVNVLGKGVIPMSDLSVGDSVLTSADVYERVYGFAHKDMEAERIFYQFFVNENEKPLEMTSNHLVYKQGSSVPVAARSIEVGDILAGLEGGMEVRKIEYVLKQGIYAPLTQSGNIVVDEIKASNYVSLQEGSEYARFNNGVSVGISQHFGIHMFLTPFRVLCKSGLSNVCAADEMPSFVKKGIELAKFADAQNTLAQFAMLIIALAIFAPMYFAESFGFSLAFGLVVAVIAARSVSIRKVKSA